jgi:hypothetical protein
MQLQVQGTQQESNRKRMAQARNKVETTDGQLMAGRARFFPKEASR